VTTHPFLHPFSPPTKAESDFIRIVSGEGSTLWDDQGRSYIDGMASLWYCQVGHGRTEIVDAVADQLRVLEAYNTFDPFTNEPAARVTEMVVARSPLPDGRVFLTCSGSEAVDTALKLARLCFQLRDDPDRQIVVSRGRGYHGTNLGGTSAQGIPLNKAGWGDLAPHFRDVPGDDLEGMATLFTAEGERIAAVISEPVQGAGGVWPPADGYLDGIRRLCDQHGALLILDEVISGFGRLGEWFGSQAYGVTPDLITFAKGVTSGYQPLAGVIVSRAVCDTLESAVDLLRTGYTYSGHPAACAAGIANLAVLEDEDLLSRALKVGAQLRSGLEALRDDGLVTSVRGAGAVYAAELGRDAAPVRDRLLELGVIVRPLGTALAFCPPLVITDDEIGRILDAMSTALA
jgi:putrescine---pyruvate transaminase